MSELEVQGLVKRLNGQLILDHVSFRIGDGEFFVLVGPSGSGKTSILRLISGLEQPDEGRILINGQEITRLQPHQRNISLVFEEYGLYPHMSVFDNIAYALKARGLGKQEIELRILMAVDILKLTPLLRRPVANLSGGEKQRVALARALVKDAEIYLFDEPLANLDARLRYDARQEVMLVHRLKRKPSLYITHDQTEAFAMADRIAVLVNGQTQQIGTPDEILNTPANLFMARFIGTPPMNIIPGQLQRSETLYYFVGDGIIFPLPYYWTSTLANYGQREVLLGFRPTALIPEWIFRTLDSRPEALMRGEVRMMEELVTEKTVTFKIGHATEISGLFEDVDGVKLEVGQVIFIGLALERICLFDPMTEQALLPGNT